MSRSVTGSAVRYAPERGHRSQRKPPVQAAASALGIAIPVGVAGVIGIGLDRALPIAAVTAVLTVLAVLLWRWTLPLLVSVTVTDSGIVHRSYGRTRKVQRNEHLRGAARLLEVQHGFQTPLLILTGDGGHIMLNTDIWREQDLVEIAGPEVSWTTQPATVDVKQFEQEFPGLLPGHVTHPHRFAILFIVVAVAAIIAVTAAFNALAAESDTEDTRPAPATAPTQARELTKAQAGTQNRLQSDVQRLLGADTDWSPADTTIRDCTSSSGWQRVLSWTNSNPRPEYTADDVAKVTAAANDASLSLVEGADQRTLNDIAFRDAQTEAGLDVTIQDGSLTVTTASACAMP